MFGTQPEMVFALRAMAREGAEPSAMLHRLVSHHAMPKARDSVDRNLLVQYFTEAFCFEDCQAYAIFGWLPEEQGELKDGDIDRLLAKRIQRTRGEWDNANLTPHAAGTPNAILWLRRERAATRTCRSAGARSRPTP